MIRVELQVLIGRPPADVFAHITRVESYPDWQRGAGITRVVREEADPLVPGSRFVMDRVTRGNAGRVLCTVTASDPGRRFAFRSTDSAGFEAEVDTLLVPEGPATRLVWRFAMTTPGMLRFLGSVVAGEVRKAATADLETLKRMLEEVAAEG